jgi:uncharacterized phage protein (TIGR02218 family)
MSLAEHLKTGCTTVCRCWSVHRRDGVVLGFTDHDEDLGFDGLTFSARTGLTASALAQSTGLAVDNSEATGALSSLAVTEEDLRVGRYDGAEVRFWRVNWADLSQRALQFRGTIGEVSFGSGQFKAELRGLTEALNRPFRRVFQRDCGAVLGDARCKIDLARPEWSATATVLGAAASVIEVPPLTHVPGLFAFGRVDVLSGRAEGLAFAVKADEGPAGRRRVILWQEPGLLPEPGDQVRLVAGCDRQAATCRNRFGNFLNFRGFPHIPGDDWSMAVPSRAEQKDGGSRMAP